jgi:hypothetical protein
MFFHLYISTNWVRAVALAAAQSESIRFGLDSIRFEVGKEETFVVASDAHRIHVARLPVGVGKNCSPFNATVPIEAFAGMRAGWVKLRFQLAHDFLDRSRGILTLIPKGEPTKKLRYLGVDSGIDDGASRIDMTPDEERLQRTREFVFLPEPYANWRKVLPSGKPSHFAQSLNLQHMVDVSKAMDLVLGKAKGRDAPKFSYYGRYEKSDPAGKSERQGEDSQILAIEIGERFLCILAPMRVAPESKNNLSVWREAKKAEESGEEVQEKDAETSVSEKNNALS